MFNRGPVVISSLEEDFKKIGLLAESKTVETPAEEPVVEGDEGEEGAEGENEIDEAARRIRRRTVAGGRKLATTKRTPASARMKSKRNYRKTKIKVKLRRKKKMRNARFRRRTKLLAKRAQARRGESNDNPIANLIEEVQDIVTSLDTKRFEEAIKSFANIALISDMLSNTLGEWAEQLDESFSDQETYDTLREAAESLADLAEKASQVASALKEGQEVQVEGEGGSLEVLFKEYMEDLLEGMDLYNEVDAMHGKAGNVGQPNAIKKKGAMTPAPAAKGESDEGDDEEPVEEGEEGSEDEEPVAEDDEGDDEEPVAEGDEDDDEGDDDEEGDDDDEGDDEEPEVESKKKRPSKR